jgi:hypothetical protein
MYNMTFTVVFHYEKKTLEGEKTEEKLCERLKRALHKGKKWKGIYQFFTKKGERNVGAEIYKRSHE